MTKIEAVANVYIPTFVRDGKGKKLLRNGQHSEMSSEVLQTFCHFTGDISGFWTVYS